ncbi:MAG: hypothetical protein ACT4PN_09190 [Nitrospiraceae bacterium]
MPQATKDDGRDVFAAAAVWLSTSVPPLFLGPVAHDPIHRVG